MTSSQEIFGKVYAKAYDTLYREVDYDAECEVLTRVFSEYGQQGISTVLDLGCGTGNHAIRLASRGFRVAGVDASESMLEIGRRKVAGLDLPVTFHSGDIRTLSLGQVFDAAIMMGAVFGYQVTNPEVQDTLKCTRKHLRTQGLLVLEFWFGPAVITQRPGDRVRILEEGDTTTIRSSSGVMDALCQTVDVQFHVWQIQGDLVVARTREQHTMRYFFPKELQLLLEHASFELLKLGAAPDLQRPPDETTWHVMAVARAV
ncbi:MAG: class I SAM-dependent methyltransferase [Methanomicrobiales archaeon]|nr:class I SAM-dependent methyltransferase [Methanomicrobiales archaeon]MDD1654568.1 class I SAM-dependent methyltransferase [Methanomicrobiales archaeon]